MKETDIITDHTGLETLNIIGRADKFNQWMYDAIQPYCRGKIIEIGSGTGNISQLFLQNGLDIFLSDINSAYCNLLKHKFAKFPNLLGVEPVDLASGTFLQQYSQLFQKFDTLFALNVLEHIEDDNTAIRNAQKLLKPGGRIILLVPAYPSLYCRFDKELGHFRRYTRKSLKKVLLNNGNSIEKEFSFNSAGIAGWLLFGKLSGRKQIEQTEMGIFNQLVPFFKFMDQITFRKTGLSIIIVASKPDEQKLYDPK
jgi:SAM-dependent methyltransferase